VIRPATRLPGAPLRRRPAALPTVLLAAALAALPATVAWALPVAPPVPTAPTVPPAPTRPADAQCPPGTPGPPQPPGGLQPPGPVPGPPVGERSPTGNGDALGCPPALGGRRVGPGALRSGPPPEASIVWRRSRALGRPNHGRLVRGVELPAAGTHFVTVNPVTGHGRNPAWRRNGTDRLVRALLGVAEGYAAAHPGVPRLVVGDLSRPHGGRFGREYGGDGHRSHQNGLDADVFYPRRDGLERIPTRVGQIDRRLAQDLVRRFVRAGAQYVFVGPRTGLHGPPKVVMTLANHDDHLHVRIRPGPRFRQVIDRAVVRR
jgi:Penicillin-insensitive murein endopeptidase